jgi:hypothetical protein
MSEETVWVGREETPLVDIRFELERIVDNQWRLSFIDGPRYSHPALTFDREKLGDLYQVIEDELNHSSYCVEAVEPQLPLED